MAGTILLGPPVRRAEWPEPFRGATAPTSLSVVERDGVAEVLDGLGIPVASLRLDDPAARGLYGMVCVAAFLGRGDGTHGRAGFEVRQGRGKGGRREWHVVDGRGVVHARSRRWMLESTAPAGFSVLRDVANLAYAEGAVEAALAG